MSSNNINAHIRADIEAEALNNNSNKKYNNNTKNNSNKQMRNVSESTSRAKVIIVDNVLSRGIQKSQPQALKPYC